MTDVTEGRPIVKAEFDRVKFNLWAEDDWIAQAKREEIPVEEYVYFYEIDLLYAFLHFLRPGDVCIDAGANLGYHTLFMSHLVGPTGYVVAFEPDPVHFARLKANLELNGDPENVQIFQAGLWSDRVDDAAFWSIKGGGYSSFARFYNFSPTKILVKALRLDDIVNLDSRIRMIKIDCEGAEEQILRGGKETLARTDCLIVEFNFQIMGAFGSTDRTIRDFMREQGFDLYILRRDSQEPMYVPDDVRIEMKGRKPHMFNGLFVRPGIYEVKTVAA